MLEDLHAIQTVTELEKYIFFFFFFSMFNVFVSKGCGTLKLKLKIDGLVGRTKEAFFVSELLEGSQWNNPFF